MPPRPFAPKWSCRPAGRPATQPPALLRDCPTPWPTDPDRRSIVAYRIPNVRYSTIDAFSGEFARRRRCGCSTDNTSFTFPTRAAAGGLAQAASRAAAVSSLAGIVDLVVVFEVPSGRGVVPAQRLVRPLQVRPQATAPRFAAPARRSAAAPGATPDTAALSGRGHAARVAAHRSRTSDTLTPSPPSSDVVAAGFSSRSRRRRLSMHSPDYGRLPSRVSTIGSVAPHSEWGDGRRRGTDPHWRDRSPPSPGRPAS